MTNSKTIKNPKNKIENKKAINFDKFIRVISKLGSQKHLSALRDGFALSIPLTIAGAIAIFFITVVFGGWGAEKTSLLGLLAYASGGVEVSYGSLTNSSDLWTLTGDWATLQQYGVAVFSWINAATLGLISIYVCLLIGYSLAVIRRYKSPVLVATICLGVFFALTGVNMDLFSASGMLIAIFAALVGGEFFIWLTNSGKLELKLPPSVPPAVGRAFGILLPGFITVFFASLINVIVSLPFIWMGQLDPGVFKTFAYVVIEFVQTPFLSVIENGAEIPLLFIYIFGVSLLFFFGIHGPNTLNGIFIPIATLLWIDNLAGGDNVFVEQIWNGFVFFGGSGATLPLVIMALWFLPKGSPTKEVAKFALPVGVFEVNEPVIFGFPIVFNPKWFFPFVFGGMLAVIWPILAVKGGWMNAPTIPAPWTTPPILYGLIVTQFDWRSIIVSLLSMATLFIVYFPFVIWQRKEDKNLIMKAKQNEGNQKKGTK